MTVSSELAFVPLAATPTYSATTAGICSYSDPLRHRLRDAALEVIEIAPPAVATNRNPKAPDGKERLGRNEPAEAFL